MPLLGGVVGLHRFLVALGMAPCTLARWGDGRQIARGRPCAHALLILAPHGACLFLRDLTRGCALFLQIRVLNSTPHLLIEA